MKTQLRKLRLIAKIFDPKYFYSIDVTKYEIKLQGMMNTDIIAKCNSLKIAIEVGETGTIRFIGRGLRIVLTD